MPAETPVEKLRRVVSFETLLAYMGGTLRWPYEASDLQDVTFSYTAKELGMEALGDALPEFIRRLRENENEAWRIFLVDFGDKPLRRQTLRQLLNAVAARARGAAGLKVYVHTELLFVCKHSSSSFTFAHFHGDRLANAKLKTFGWDDPDRARTALTRNLPLLVWDQQADWEKAWDAEKLTKDFFDDYRKVFEAVEKMVVVLQGDDVRRFTQSLFNRLMFLCFLQEKGWLEYKGERKDYLFRLHETFKPVFIRRGGPQETRFYDRLRLLFFAGLNSSNGGGDRSELEKFIGKVPFLNGGLFEEDKGGLDASDVFVPDEAFPLIFDLFRKYTFTVTESTPLDIEVALDPEMLGKIFEELVTGRHGTGSYYTPRPVVSFMCREALKGYLTTSPVSGEFGEQEQGIDLNIPKLVDEHDAAGIGVDEARQLIKKLEAIKVCDPACGSGAYLLGMLQEIHALQQLLDTTAHQLSAREDYDRKLTIIENCLYGVDIDPFAINIAWLRLWLALVIDDKRNPLDDDVSLPNLDVKVEIGDSLLAPAPIDVLRAKQGAIVGELVRQFRAEKASYMRSHIPVDKDQWREAMSRSRRLIDIELRGNRDEAEAAVEREREALATAKNQGGKDAASVRLRRAEAALAALGERPPPDSLDWAVEFVEAFVNEDARCGVSTSSLPTRPISATS
ncbi:MAG: hypothetical protein H0W86_12250 [Armatimonadetes bacterium]|nr:hypothetical protein [Armatimonadota bacterium]